MTEQELERFMQKVNVNSVTGCWEWTGAINPRHYAAVWINKEVTVAHRAIYIHYFGRIESGKQIDHLCSVKHCVNPAHLQKVTNLENRRLSIIRKEDFNSSKTHCKRGHELFGDNLYKHTKARACRECARIRDRERKSKKRGQNAIGR